MKVLLVSALFISAAAYVSAEPVEVWINPGPNLLSIGLDIMGTIDCSQFSSTSASCSTNFAALNGQLQAGGTVNAAASFGSASGSAYGGGSSFNPGVMYYLASFANDVVVTGATGTGTLVTDYQISAGSFQLGDPSINPNEALNDPQFSFVQGSTKLNMPTDLTNASPSFTNEPVDITTSFQFGTPFAFGAETQDAASLYSYLGPNNEGGANSSLKLIGFTVLDSSGNVVAGAQIVPGAALGTGIFTPEPLSGLMALVGLALISSVAPLRRR